MNREIAFSGEARLGDNPELVVLKLNDHGVYKKCKKTKSGKMKHVWTYDSIVDGNLKNYKLPE